MPDHRSAFRLARVVVLSGIHLWRVQSCLSGIAAPQLPAACAAPPLTTLALLALAFIELTRGSRLRGAMALVVVAFPIVMGMVAEGID